MCQKSVVNEIPLFSELPQVLQNGQKVQLCVMISSSSQLWLWLWLWFPPFHNCYYDYDFIIITIVIRQVVSQVLLSPLWHPRNPKLRETILNSRQNDNKLFFTIQHWMSNEGFSFINSLGNSLNVAICSGFNTNYKLDQVYCAWLKKGLLCLYILYWVIKGLVCMYILEQVEIWSGVTDASQTDRQ